MCNSWAQGHQVGLHHFKFRSYKHSFSTTCIFSEAFSWIQPASDDESRWGRGHIISKLLSISQQHGLLFWGEENHPPDVVLRGHSLQGNKKLWGQHITWETNNNAAPRGLEIHARGLTTNSPLGLRSPTGPLQPWGHQLGQLVGVTCSQTPASIHAMSLACFGTPIRNIKVKSTLPPCRSHHTGPHDQPIGCICRSGIPHAGLPCQISGLRSF